MKLLRLLTILAALAFAGVAAADADEYGDESTLARSTFSVATAFRGLPAGAAYDVTWTAHFAGDDRYVLGGSFGDRVRPDGTYTVMTLVDDFTYFDPAAPLEYVRVCLRPPRSPATTEIVGPDGHALCDNVPTGGYRSTYEDDPYAATTHALTVARTVAVARAVARPGRP